MQTMSIPELIVSFFKAIFYAFYYSGYGVIGIIKYLLIDVLMSLMRGPNEEVNEQPPIREDQFMVKALTDTQSDEFASSSAAAAAAAAMLQSASAASALDASKDEGGNELATPSSVASGERTGDGAIDDGSGEQTEQQTGEEPPLTLVIGFLLNFPCFAFESQLKLRLCSAMHNIYRWIYWVVRPQN